MSSENPTTAPAVPSNKGLLTNRNFLLFSSGQAISNLGDVIYATVLVIWVYELTNSAAAVGGALMALYIPIFTIGPIAGVFVDRWDRRWTMIISDVARMLIILLPLIVPTAWYLPSIYVSVFLASVFSRFFRPARSGIVQAIISEQQMPQAASINQSLLAMIVIIGPAIAAPLFFLVGPFFALLTNAVSFLISALCLLAILAPKEVLHPYAFREDRKDKDQGINSVLSELREGIVCLGKTRVLVIIVIMGMIAMLGSGAIHTLDIVYVNQNLHLSSAFYGPLTAAAGMGMLIGSILAGLLAKKIEARFLLAGGILLLGIGIIFYSLQTWLIMALVISFLMSSAQGALHVGIGPLLLNNTPRTMMGRVQSVFETATVGANLISISLAGYLGQMIPVSMIFIFCGVLFVVSGLFGWFAIPPQR